MSELKNRRRISDFGNSIFLILLAVVFFWMTRSPEPQTVDNTTKIKSILSSAPESGVHGESRDYIGFHLVGFNDFFEFTRCSYDDQIAYFIEELQVGDSITIHYNPNKSSTTYPWKGEKYQTYRICAASSPKHGTYVKFSQYNACLERKAKVLYPLMCGVLIILAFVDVVKTFKMQSNQYSTKYLNPAEHPAEETYFQLRPDKTSYLLSHLGAPIFLLIAGWILAIFSYPGTWYYVGFGMAGLGIYLILHFLRIHSKIFYILDEEGVHIKSISLFFQAEMKTITYNSIKEVTIKRHEYEYHTNVGTVLIYVGEKGEEGNKIYHELIGVEKFQEVHDLISRLNQDEP